MADSPEAYKRLLLGEAPEDVEEIVELEDFDNGRNSKER